MKRLGIIGGMGPAATAQLYQRIIDLTDASCDQEHLDVTILSDPSIPDRTSFLLGKPGAVDFVPRLQEKAVRLAQWGCEVLAIPCNTSHARFDDIAAVVPNTQLLHMPREAARFTQALGCRRVLILATDGTVQTGVFQRACQSEGIEAVIPDGPTQETVMAVIYRYVKAGQLPPASVIDDIVDALPGTGADSVILGCTELSTLGLGTKLGGLPLVDALDVLALRCVEACGAAVSSKARADFPASADQT